MPKYKRVERLRELFREKIAESLLEVKDPGLTSSFLTITDVELAGDAKTAKIYWSILGSAEDKKNAADALERSSAFIRQLLYRKLSLKFIPKISFHYDDTPEQAQKIENLLDRLRAEEKGETPAEPKQDDKGLGDIASRGTEKPATERFRRRKDQ